MLHEVPRKMSTLAGKVAQARLSIEAMIEDGRFAQRDRTGYPSVFACSVGARESGVTAFVDCLTKLDEKRLLQLIITDDTDYLVKCTR